jgi:cysteinyl-tRNA synthetase
MEKQEENLKDTAGTEDTPKRVPIQISVTRALSAVSTLEKQLESDLHDMRGHLMAVRTPRDNDETEADFDKTAKALLQSYEDKLTYYNYLKSAIAESNAKTLVNIGGVTYTVASAIIRKNAIAHEEALLSTIRYEISEANSDYARTLEIRQRKIDKLVEKSVETTNTKSSTAMDTIRKTIEDAEPYSLMDPLQLGRRSQNLAENISSFQQEVDVALSETNATTYIVIGYQDVPEEAEAEQEEK